MDHVHAQRAKRFLLGDGHMVEQLYVQDDLRRLRARSRHENRLPSQPWPPGLSVRVLRGNGIGEDEA